MIVKGGKDVVREVVEPVVSLAALLAGATQGDPSLLSINRCNNQVLL